MTDRTEELVGRHPTLLSNVYCGLSLPPGWFDLVDTLCFWIDGRKEYGGKVKVAQIKEKFGGLRFYTDSHDLSDEECAKLFSVIRFAEALSFRICEECGAPAKRENNGGWLATLCTVHRRDAGREPSACS